METITETTNKPPSNSPKAAKGKKGISFGEVRVREHERILNHRPSAKYADLAMGWAHHASEHHLVDDFEKIKEEEHHKKKKHKEHERLQVLAKYGYSTKDVLTLEKDKKKALERREKGIPEEPEDTAKPRPIVRGIKSLFAGVGFKKKAAA
jgi:cupin superfamily acireductone dioxygenase involved in methionine salvage